MLPAESTKHDSPSFSGEILEIQWDLAGTLENSKELKGMGKEEFRGMEELGMCQHMDTST
jgi:hypothetical protein